jgi:peptide/nickel transport system permease protein
VALLAVALSVTIGAMVGLVSGYWGGLVDAALMRMVDGALAIPRLFILLLVLAVWERVPVLALIVLIGATGWFATSRLVRGEVLRIREEGFVRAAEALGARRRRIIFRHLLPNALGPLLVAATLGVGDVILLEAGLSFLGLGIQPPTPSWGGMILDSREVMISAPWAGIFPGLAIVITVLSANLFGDALRDAVDPRSA